MQSSSPDRPGISWAGPLFGQNGIELLAGARDYLANARDLLGLDPAPVAAAAEQVAQLPQLVADAMLRL